MQKQESAIEYHKNKYSILMSVYKKEKPEYLNRSIESMMEQSVQASEFVIVEDGELTTSLYKVLDNYERKYPKIIKRIRLKKNSGLGLALKAGLEKCNSEIIVRMDSDDYSLPYRVEMLLRKFAEDPSLSIVGSNVVEIMRDLDDKQSLVVLPETNDQIIEFSKKRCPFRHPAVAFKKDAILNSGGYRHYPLLEDYDLFMRVINHGYKCYNLQENLVLMQTSDDFYKRRGGIRYLTILLKFEKELHRNKIISTPRYLSNVMIRSLSTLSPNFLRRLLYTKFLRGQ